MNDSQARAMINNLMLPGHRTIFRRPAAGSRTLTIEEDAVIVEADDDDFDPTLPADLWFRSRRRA